MLEGPVSRLFIYVVSRDFGFAPNPFHGCCTLATCKPDIRKSAKVGDWIMGVGGSRLNAVGRCLYLMEVSEILTFDEYWVDERFERKKPLRNGSALMMVGDNIYHRKSEAGPWIQEDSHHSNPDGTPNETNMKTDTGSLNVLVSWQFYYFGLSAPQVPLGSIDYKNVRNYRKFTLNDKAVRSLIERIVTTHDGNKNCIADDPFDFANAAKRADQATGKVS